MEQFKDDQEVKEFFKSEIFKFEIICDNVAQFKTVRPIEIDGNYTDFQVSTYPESKPFMCYDSLDDLMGDMKIFEVYSINTFTNEHKPLYYNTHEVD